MRTRLDDELFDHPKIMIAGDILGKNGRVVALGFYVGAILYSNKHLTDGFLATGVIKTFLHIDNAPSIADALVKAALLEKVDGGFKVHDFHEHNQTAAEIKKKRKEDRARKRN